MRQIGTIAKERDAKTFADYLLTLGITTRLMESSEGWTVWVHKENFVDRGRMELQKFQVNPHDSRYDAVSREAEAIRRKAEEEDRQHAKNTVDLRGKLGQGGPGMAPVTRYLIIISIAVTALNWIAASNQRGSLAYPGPLYQWLTFSSWSVEGRSVQSDGVNSILSGQVWRLFTPIFIHFGAIHLLFNMFMTFRLGGLIEWRQGSRLMLGLVVWVALISNIAQHFFPDAFTIPGYGRGGGPFGGMSGVVYGLFGYAWVKGRSDPSSGLYLNPDTVVILLGWLVVCAFNLIPIANTAHVVGMLAGMMTAASPFSYGRSRP